MRRIVSIVLLLVLVSAACGGADESFPDDGPSETPVTTSPPQAGIEQADADLPAGSTPPNTVPGRFDPAAQPLDEEASGEVPDSIIAMVLEDAGSTSDEAAFQVAVARTVVWSDGSLGCPEPGVLYTQALVDGYQVVVSGPGGDHDYRITDNGYFFICDQNG
ncbi:MAG TPA: hypothetical protein ENH15_02735 [Actinobacteria bacterium]|nr:hypothetical protein [Actinomycetota bacterium]